MVHPGQTLNLDYSLTHTFPLHGALRLQLGLVGYGQWQTTAKECPKHYAGRGGRALQSQRVGVCSKRTITGAEGERGC